MGTSVKAGGAVDNLTVTAYSIPTDAPEADGTFEWQQTTMVLVEIEAGGKRGLGYTYTDAAAATLIHGTLADVIRGRSVMDIQAAWVAMARLVRNMGRPGIAASAIAAIDTALWDIKAKLLDVPIYTGSDIFWLKKVRHTFGGFILVVTPRRYSFIEPNCSVVVHANVSIFFIAYRTWQQN